MGSATHVGVLLRDARKGLFRRGLNWRRIEDDLLLRKSSVEHWEAGRVRKVPFAQVVALADYLGIPIEDLQEAALADASDLRDAQRGVAASPNGAGAPRPTAADRADAMAERMASQERRQTDRRTRQRRSDLEQGE